MTSAPSPIPEIWPKEFGLAQSHCYDVLVTGVYDLPVEPATILDLGANVGAFARWASQRWPSASVHCYEPHPTNFALLDKTIAHYGLKNVTAHALAIGVKAGTATLFENGFNCGEWSLIKFTPEGTGKVEVAVIDALELPEADFIKIDTEGFELNILKRLADAGKLAKTKAVVLEYHASVHVAVLIFILQQVGMRLHSVGPVSDHRGVLRFIR